MKSITIDIINEKVMKLLKDLEFLQLIRVRNEKISSLTSNREQQYKGSMTKQSLIDVDKQLNELRSGWD